MSFREFLQESKVDLVVKSTNKDYYEVVKVNNKELKSQYEPGDEIAKDIFVVGKDGSIGFNGYNVEVK